MWYTRKREEQVACGDQNTAGQDCTLQSDKAICDPTAGERCHIRLAVYRP